MHNKQVVSQRCPECNSDFVVGRGSVYDGGQGMVLYRIALHGHTLQVQLAHLAVAVLDRPGEQPHLVATAVDAECRSSRDSLWYRGGRRRGPARGR